MGYFPFFVELAGLEGLIIGGGPVALRKAEKLAAYQARLTVCAPEFLPEFETLPGLILRRQPFEPSLLEGKAFAVCAAGERALNRRIALLCRERRIPVNAVDDQEACSFLFPALVKRGRLSIGISTGGASPSAAVFLKERIAASIPEDFGDLLEYLCEMRERVKASVPDERRRAACLSRLLAACMEGTWPLDDAAWHEILRQTFPDTEAES